MRYIEEECTRKGRKIQISFPPKDRLILCKGRSKPEMEYTNRQIKMLKNYRSDDVGVF